MRKNMKHTNKIMGKVLLGGLALSLLITGCKKDYLDLKPTESISNTEAFTSPAKLSAAMTGIYDLVSNPSYLYNIMLNADAKGEDAFPNSTGNYNRFVAGYQYLETVNNGELQIHWSQGYRIIANCNQLIENTPNAPVSAGDKARYIAEATAIRAFVHFQLVQEFGEKSYALNPEALGVPIMTKSSGPNDEKPARAKVKDVYAAILADLTFAEANFPSSVKGVYRINKNAIHAIQARVYMAMENWAKGSEYAKKAYTGITLASAQSLLAGFRTPTSEWIWALNSRDDDNSGYLGVHSFYDPYDDGYSSFRVSKEFFAQFSDDDIRQNQFRIPANRYLDPTTGDIYLFGDGYLTSKFVFDGFTNNQLIFRSSEMILTEAEAEARLGNETPAKAALLIIQKRAIPSAELSINTGADLIAEIMLERRKELFGEGQRYYDILRTKQGLDRSASTSHWSKLTIPASDKRFALPIPQAEINVNPKIVQNPL